MMEIRERETSEVVKKLTKAVEVAVVGISM